MFGAMEESVGNSKILDRDPRAAIGGMQEGERTGAHRLTFLFVAAFAYAVYFRPHEFYPDVPVVNSLPMLTAAGALVSFLLTELMGGGKQRKFPTEVKCVLVMTAFALLTIPISRDPALAWRTFNDLWLPLVLVFFVTANVLTSLRRIKTLMLLGVAIGVYLSYQTYDLYSQGIFEIEGYRVAVDFGGMFGNPNDMSIHLVMFTPIAVCIGFIGRNIFVKLFFFSCAGIMTIAVSLTQSRGGFLGIVAVWLLLVWILNRGRRLKAFLAAGLIAGVFFSFAPVEYGTRVLSIFDSSLDATGSFEERGEVLKRSILVTLRNPWGVGLGNSVTFGLRNLETHNAFTQVSSELGVGGLIAYLVMLISSIRNLYHIEGELKGQINRKDIYYLTVGTYAAIVGYMISSFFASVAYLWYVYYPVAFAIGLREIHESLANRLSSVAALSHERAKAGRVGSCVGT